MKATFRSKLKEFPLSKYPKSGKFLRFVEIRMSTSKVTISGKLIFWNLDTDSLISLFLLLSFRKAYFHLLFGNDRHVVEVTHNEKVNRLEVQIGKEKKIAKK